MNLLNSSKALSFRWLCRELEGFHPPFQDSSVACRNATQHTTPTQLEQSRLPANGGCIRVSRHALCVCELDLIVCFGDTFCRTAINGCVQAVQSFIASSSVTPRDDHLTYTHSMSR